MSQRETNAPPGHFAVRPHSGRKTEMTNPNAHDIKVLNGLIETTLDSADGYREAAEQTQD